MTMPKKDRGTTRSGKLVTDDCVDELAQRAEGDFDVDEIIRRRGGRRPMGSAAVTVASVRLDPEPGRALRDRAQRNGRTNSDVIHEALRDDREAG
jgi:hypothetical protein